MFNFCCMFVYLHAFFLVNSFCQWSYSSFKETLSLCLIVSSSLLLESSLSLSLSLCVPHLTCMVDRGAKKTLFLYVCLSLCLSFFVCLTWNASTRDKDRYFWYRNIESMFKTEHGPFVLLFEICSFRAELGNSLEARLSPKARILSLQCEQLNSKRSNC